MIPSIAADGSCMGQVGQVADIDARKPLTAPELLCSSTGIFFSWAFLWRACPE